MFKVVRLGELVLIVPKSVANELRSLPEHDLSSRHLTVYNLYGKSTTTEVLLESDLHSRMIRNRMTPNLLSFATSTLEEIEYTLDMEFPSNRDQWTSMKINHNLLYVVAGVTTRAISGTSLCRNRRWLSTCINYTENIFITMLILRLFPRVLHRLISNFLPSSWLTHIYLRRAKSVLIPIIEQRLKERKTRSTDEKISKSSDLLQYMIEEAEGDDLQPERLARLKLMSNLAAIHTSSMAITHAIYDLCEHPKYVQLLRDEVEQVLQNDNGWQPDTYTKLHKIDSFLKESQRFAPATLLSFNRVALTSLTLSSGLIIPAGTHFSVAAREILFDPEVTPNPDVFDGLRYYKLRENNTDSHKYQFASLDGVNMNFGAGRYACPGRYFASMELKLLLAQLLLKFDFQFPPGQGRPSLLVMDEMVAPVPWAKVMVRRREHTP
jgi:hypothetical protein